MKIVDLSKSEHVKILRDLIFDEKLLHISSPDFIKYFENCYCYLIGFYERSKKKYYKTRQCPYRSIIVYKCYSFKKFLSYIQGEAK